MLSRHTKKKPWAVSERLAQIRLIFVKRVGRVVDTSCGPMKTQDSLAGTAHCMLSQMGQVRSLIDYFQDMESQCSWPDIVIQMEGLDSR